MFWTPKKEKEKYVMAISQEHYMHKLGNDRFDCSGVQYIFCVYLEREIYLRYMCFFSIILLFPLGLGCSNIK